MRILQEGTTDHSWHIVVKCEPHYASAKAGEKLYCRSVLELRADDIKRIKIDFPENFSPRYAMNPYNYYYKCPICQETKLLAEGDVSAFSKGFETIKTITKEELTSSFP